ncbi:GNAT family N-acetyltransferase [Bacillus zhangzhouensis]|nr:GNAT family N-acetyltransferase [Bacillus zhangzhouensis]
MLEKTVWANGYAAESAKGMVSFIVPENEASVKVALKMGSNKK